MTVSNINAYSDPENGGDVGTEHTFDFRIDEGAESSVLMQLTDGDGNITYPEYNTDYTVERATEPAVGGTVTTLTDFTGSSTVLFRSTALTQTRALPNQGPFLAATIEAMVDKLTMLTQELRRDQDLTLTLPKGTDTSTVSLVMPEPVDGQYLIGRNVAGELRYSSDGMSEATLQSMTTAATADAAAAALAATDAETAATDAETAATGAEAAQAAAELARDEAVAVSGSVDSFNGRTGTVLPAVNDYAITEIENAGALAALNTVGATEIDADAVTLAELEHGVSGDILYYGAGGEPFRLAKGTDDQVLKLVNGLPAWETAESEFFTSEVFGPTVNAGTFTAGAWRTRTQNTVDRNTAGGVLASNQHTLLAGTYKIEAFAPVYHVGVNQLRYRNITDGLTAALGVSMHAWTDEGQHAIIPAQYFTISDTKVFELQHRCSTTRATIGMGTATSFDENNIYSGVRLTKVD